MASLRIMIPRNSVYELGTGVFEADILSIVITANDIIHFTINITWDPWK